MVHHRGEDLLTRCLESLLASRDVDLQVAVVANACEEPLSPLAEGQRRVHVLRSAAPLGFSAANNRAVAFLRERVGVPDYLYFVNDDTVSEPDVLRELVSHLDRDPRCAIAGPRLMIEGEGRLNSLGLNVCMPEMPAFCEKLVRFESRPGNVAAPRDLPRRMP